MVFLRHYYISIMCPFEYHVLSIGSFSNNEIYLHSLKSPFVNIFLFSFLSSCQALTWDGLWSHCWEQSNKNIFMNIIAQDQTHLSHLTKSNIISWTRIKWKEEKRIKYKIRIILDNVFILPSRGTFYVSAKWKRWSR